MQQTILFFKWLWDGCKQMFSWLVSIPAILASSVVGIIASINSLVSSLNGNASSVVTDVCSVASRPLSTFADMIQGMPDVVKLAFYSLSMDVLYRFVFAAFYLFVGGFLLVMEFQLVTIVTFYVAVYVFKLAAWFINAFFPNSFSIGGIKSIASSDVPKIDTSDVIDV